MISTYKPKSEAALSAREPMATELKSFEPDFGVPQMPNVEVDDFESVVNSPTGQSQGSAFSRENDLIFGSEFCETKVDPFTGDCIAELKLPVSAGRMGFTPPITLRYKSGAPSGSQNGAFGVGWNLELGCIESRTKSCAQGEVITEHFLDGQLLVPALRATSDWSPAEAEVGDYTVRRYQRQLRQSGDTSAPHGSLDRIEQWVNNGTLEMHWRIVNENNVVSTYGPHEKTRIQDPNDASRVSHWLISETYDDRGNVIRYSYKRENLEGVSLDNSNEAHRARGTGVSATSWRYPKRISYGNRVPYNRDAWHFHLVFDYGDHAHDDARLEDTHPWEVRPDPFSRYEAGFEQRIWRRCSRILMFHRFDELGPHPHLVKALKFSYDESQGRSLLANATLTGFINRNDGYSAEHDSEPPLTFNYSVRNFDNTVYELDSVALTNVLGTGARDASWIDLYREGLPGVVARVGDKWIYVRNLGNGNFADPEEVADVDLEQDVNPEPFSYASSPTSASHKGEYRPLSSINAPRDLNADDPRLCYIDLNDDGANDVIAATSSFIRWFPSHGDDGYADAQTAIINPNNPSSGIRLGFGDSQSFHVADMTGNGLVDIVRVEKSRVVYWPNLGRGSFGTPIEMSLPTALDSGFGRRCQFGDFTGSGTSDLVVVDDGSVRIFENYLGEGFAEPIAIDCSGLHPDSNGLGFVDVFGSGCKSIVWLDKSESTPVLRLVRGCANPAGLLVGIANGRGLETRFGYSSAVSLWIADREAGNDWLDTLGIHRSVVSQVEERDRTCNTRNVVRISYRHPHFDFSAQRFVGFAFSEYWLGLTSKEFGRNGLFEDEDVPEIDEASRAPVTYVRLWHHTGLIFEDAELTIALKDAFFEDVTLGRARWLTGPKLPRNQSHYDMVAGHHAIAGRMLRRETFSIDGPPLEAMPFCVEEWTARVEQLQPSRANTPPAFQVVLNESVEVVYERDTTDPRVTHVINVGDEGLSEYERFAYIKYAPQRPTVDAQRHSEVVVVETNLLHTTSSPSSHRANVPLSRQAWKLVFGTHPTASRLLEAREVRSAFDELETCDPVMYPATAHKRVVEHTRWRYWSNDGKHLLPVGSVESRAMVARVEKMAFKNAGVVDLYGQERLDTLRFEGGYLVDTESWWAPGPTINYDQSLFFVPVTSLDALGREVRLTWNESGMFPRRRDDSFGAVAFMDWHPRTNTIWRLGDQNGNVTAWRFDALGAVLSRTKMGSSDNQTGDIAVMSTHESASGDNPTEIVLINRNNWLINQKPISITVRARNSHGGRPSELQDRTVQLNAKGELISSAVRTRDGWAIRAAMFRDVRGRISGVSLPTDCDSPFPDRGVGSDVRSNSRWITRDALGRVIRVDNPNGTIKLIEFGPWQVTHHDENDTVLDSNWYATNSNAGRGRAGDFASRQAAGIGENMRAAALSASHARTPTVEFIDCCGLVVANRVIAATHSIIETSLVKNADGDVLRIVDGRGNEVVTRAIDLLGNVLRCDSSDTGEVVTQWSAAGDKLRVANANTTIAYRYDISGRLTHVVETDQFARQTTIERIIWGTGDVLIDSPAERNLAGFPYVVMDQNGVTTYLRRDYTGRPEVTEYRLNRTTEKVDWSTLNDITHVDQLSVGFEQFDLDAPFTSMTNYDALGEVSAARVFDRLQTQATHHTGLGHKNTIRVSADRELVREEVVRETVLQNGNIERIELQDDQTVAYVRDSLGTLREVRYATGEDVTYRERIARDAVGHVISVAHDDATTRAYAFDGAGRMVTAEMQQREDWPDSERSTTTFSWDQSGNLTNVVRGGGSNVPLIEFDIDPESNKVLRYTLGDEDQLPTAIGYTPTGSVASVGRDLKFEYNSVGQLVAVVEGSRRIVYFYSSEGQLARRCVYIGGIVEKETVFIGDFRRTRTFFDGELTSEVCEVDVVVGATSVATAVRTTLPIEHSGVKLIYRTQDATGATVSEIANLVKTREGADSTTCSQRPSASPIRFAYLPFGAMLTSDSPESDLVIHGFRGGIHDRASDLVFLNNRWYSPQLARWVSGVRRQNVATGANHYAFGSGDPVGGQL